MKLNDIRERFREGEPPAVLCSRCGELPAQRLNKLCGICEALVGDDDITLEVGRGMAEQFQRDLDERILADAGRGAFELDPSSVKGEVCKAKVRCDGAPAEGILGGVVACAACIAKMAGGRLFCSWSYGCENEAAGVAVLKRGERHYVCYSCTRAMAPGTALVTPFKGAR